MNYLLDTNVVSELRKIRAGRCDASVARWAAEVEANDIFLSVVTVFELQRGALLVGRRDPIAAVPLHAWIDGILAKTFEGRVLPVDVVVARRSAALSVPDPSPFRDSLIAATALVHGMKVVTRNVADFASTGVAILNPWAENQP